MGNRIRARPRDTERSRVRHHRGMQPVKGASLQHQNLAASPFLRRSSEHVQRHTEVVDESGQPVRDTDRRRRNEVVAAGMTEAGQCVVLSTHSQV